MYFLQAEIVTSGNSVDGISPTQTPCFKVLYKPVGTQELFINPTGTVPWFLVQPDT